MTFRIVGGEVSHVCLPEFFEFCVVPLLGDVYDVIHKFPKPDLIRIERIFAVNGVEKNTTDKEIV